MKHIHFFSLFLGIALGIFLTTSLPFTEVSHANEEKKEGLSAAEIDKRLDEILESQKELKKKLDSTLEQTGFIKIAIGK